MSNFTTTDGKRIYFEETGTGTPLLCLAGLTRNSRDFSFFAPHAADLRMIATDYRGRGRSDYDPDFMNYNILRESHDAIELLDVLGIEKTFVLGTSRGGLIAMALAASHPERLAGVILNDVGPVIETSGIAKIMAYVGTQPTAQTYDEAALTLKQVMEPQFPGVSLETWRMQAEIQYEKHEDGLALRYDPALRKALIEQAASGATPDLWMFFEALRDIPTGVIRGANSDVLSTETVAEMHDRHPGLISTEVPDRGHVPFLNEPQSLDLIQKVLKNAA
ncbi:MULTISPECIES: alpha/beta fold hydrolase [unclassified Ruegeria]|uniref:alpha/beta fold hydrolase n=1 Tax=unclassified Ruegeria TaxID=2625375 RepID=UPI001487BF0F|nr:MULTISPECIES: alpha/beta hydrolase [unclassified Ruegeria]NOD77212.1 alpha/beta fold hydrolase [Ruegeria sp. HKCCD4332]NOD89683.1 alpha/beta fold hydrolase [Ruegeria sp. HKCCD4318]NOE14006.1 alpha/beta fold hydrolase [Ruegeria sp. HKCCD4318-2]NOG08057.1 alpha/beta hydrolase [Ruegeria sp. HKCCD4315]